MSISSELTSEVVVGLLSSGEKSPQEVKILRELALVVHQTLQQLETDSRAARNRGRDFKEARRRDIIESNHMEP